MTLAALGGFSYWPPLQLQEGNFNQTMLAVNCTFDSTADRLAWVGKAYQTDSIAKIHLRTATVTTGDTLEVRIESVGTDGRPSGVLLGTNTNATVVIADADDNVWKTVTLTAAASITPGLEFAIVIVHSAESGGAGIAINFLTFPAVLTSGAGHYPLRLQDTGGGTWVSATVSGFEWIVELTTAGVVPFPGLSPLSGHCNITAFNSLNERALKLAPPFKCHAVGIRLAMFNIAAGADFTASIWDSTVDPVDGPTPLAQSSLDGDFAVSTTLDGYVDLFFTNGGVDLVAGTTYYVGLKADTVNSVSLLELPTATVTNAIRAFGAGTGVHLSTRLWVLTDPGAWSDTTTTLPCIHLIIDKLGDDAGAAGGGNANILRGSVIA